MRFRAPARIVRLLWIGLTVLGIVTQLRAGEVLSPVRGDRHNLQVLRTDFSEDKHGVTVRVSCADGIFLAQLDLPRDLSRMSIVVCDQTHCEGLTFRNAAGNPIDLRTAPGVKIMQAGKDLRIALDPVALERMRPGGELQFVNWYR